VSDGEGLLAAILANPDEDVPRLVYADWLEENGQPALAGLIRMMVADPTLDFVADKRNFRDTATPLPAWHPHTHHRLNLWKGGRRRAIRDVLPPCDGWSPETAFDFRRGFVEEITCTAGDWLAHGDALRAAHPVRKVTLTTWRASEVLDRWAETRARFVPKRYCRFKGRDRLHVLPLVDATPDDYRRVCEAEWPGVAFTLPPAADPDAFNVMMGQIITDGLVGYYADLMNAALMNAALPFWLMGGRELPPAPPG
jgi:uncharacterized protein (TIGR02996 family)